ncbi:Cell wall-associated polypeptide CWBP200 [Shewanella putrefaciens]|nr:Cell wall-associated polypeptide CWBP200 [Shewanella putrefaciens]
MLPLWMLCRQCVVALFLGLLYSSLSHAVEAPASPSLSGNKNGATIDLHWSIDCSVTTVNIQESADGSTWNSVYSGLGSPDEGTAPPILMAFSFGGGSGTYCPDWTSARYTNLPSRSLSGYYYRINACIGTACSAYSASTLVGTAPTGGTPSQSSTLASIATIPDANNSLTSPAFDELVGEIQGQATVDGGAFSYTVPLTIAPGRNGMQPSLSLNYSSQAGEGLAGMGWSLSAYSSISRCSQIYDLDATASNATYSSNDKLCYNGSRLVVTAPPNSSAQGAYGASGTFYKMERNSTVIIEQLGGALNTSSVYFKVYEANGTYHLLGGNANSRITPVGISVASSWLQQLTQDSHGNEVTYFYDTSSAGNRYLQDIYYTGYKGAQGSRSVHINYTAVPAETSYHWGGYSISNKRMSNIDVLIDGSVKAQWLFNYALPASTALNDAARLASLSYCDGTDPSQCLNTDFGWFERNYQHNLITNHALAAINDNYTVGLAVRKDNDYDGDGVADLSIPLDGIYLSRTGTKVSYRTLPYKSTENWAGDINGDGVPAANEYSGNMVNGAIDYDLDGADDFVYTDNNSQLIITSLLPSGAIKRTYSTGINATCYASVYRDIGDKFCASHVMDFDGDGRKDILLATNKQAGVGNFTITYKAYQRKAVGDGFDYRGSFSVSAAEPLIPIDVDGDGVPDLAPSQFNSTLKWYKVVFNRVNNTVSFIEKNQTFAISVDKTYRATPSRWVDFNGDGLSDILTLHKVKSTDNFFTRHIIINKGAGLFEAPYNTGMKELAWTVDGGNIAKDPLYGGPAGYVHERFIQFVDYNGDGRQDILYPDRLRKKYTYECWAWSSNEACDAVDGASAPYFYDYDVWHWNVLLTNPDGKTFTDVQLPIYGALATLSPIDLTGDGRVDFVSGVGFESDAVKRTWFYGSKQGGKPSSYPVGFLAFAHATTQDTVINSVNTGMGQKLQLDYAQLKQHYSVAESTLNYPYVYFTNTMRVVSTLKSDNGVGGVDTTQYSYKNARFHVAGRGFQGFSDIIETRSDALNSESLTTLTQFEQTFPWSGMVKYKKVTDSRNNTLSEYSVQKNAPLPGSYVVGQSACFYPQESTTTKWTVNPNISVATVKETTLKNTHCQVTSNTVASEDSTVKHTQTTTQAFTNSLGWLMPTVSSTNQTVAYKTPHESVVLNPANTATGQRVTHTYGTNEQGVMALTSTKVEGIGSLTGTGSTTQFSAYDPYGHALKTTVGDRYTQVSMSNDGYFVYQTFNAQWPGVASSTTQYDPLTGAVLTSIDINGVTTTNTVNFIGKITSSGSAKGATVVTPTVYSSMEWLTGNYAYSVTQRSSGQPETIVYFDSLNREVKTVTAGFAGDIITAKRYDVRGNLVSETRPTQSYGTAEVVQYQGFDVLGRPSHKLYDDGMVAYQSQYTYVDGIRTDINVSGDFNLQMSRSYNSLGQLLSTTDAKGHNSYFAYNAAGLPVLIQDVLGSRITAQYDDLGRKAWFDDPNMGKWLFSYNQFAELATQTDARNLVTTFTYDKLGRQTKQTNTQTTRTWVYDTTVGNGKLYQASVAGHTQTHSYDTAGRMIQTITQMGGLNLTEKYAYDSQFGRLKAMAFPSGEHVAYRFDDNGYLIEDYQRFTDGSELSLRTVESYSALGSINQQRFSNGKIQQFFRNEAGSPLSICTSNNGSCSTAGIQYLNYDYDAMGNLVRQENAITRFAEDYTYDELMRVDNSTKTVKGTTYAPINYDYDAAGNILVKGDYGSSYLYGSVGKGLGGNAGPNAIRQFIRGGTTSNFTYDNNGNRLTGDGATLTYDDQNKPLTVVRNGTTSTFSYDANGQRYKQVKQQGSSITTTYYVGSFEREVSSSATIDKTYIGDHTIKMKAHVGSLGNQSPFQHVLRDHLGSVDTLIDGQTGAVLQYRGYDVFGRPRDIAAGNALLTAWQGVTKGYTDHEHLNEQQLIHMNGRIYDFNVGRFLSVDPFLQFPENSQSANPYSYILNNPMSGTDPTGYAATGGDCTTGSNTGFKGFCTSVQLADTESKKKNKATVGNGEANGKLTISGEAKRVGEVGLQLEKSGGKLVSGQTNLDGTVTESYSFGQNGNTTYFSGVIYGVLNSVLESNWSSIPLNATAGLGPASDFFGNYASPLPSPVSEAAALGDSHAPWYSMAVGVIARDPKSIIRNADGVIEKPANLLLEVLSKAKLTQGHPNQVMYQLDDGTKVLFRKDFGDQAHNIGGPFQGKGAIDHYNVQIQNARGKTIENLHIVPNGTEGFIRWGKDNVIK